MSEERRDPDSFAKTVAGPAATAVTCVTCGLGTQIAPGAPAADCRKCGTPLGRQDPPGETLGKFVLLRQVGQGGFGTVYQAWQRDLGRHVALKVLHSELAEDVLRFLREAEIAAKLSHPNIVPIHEMGEHGGRRYICMEFVRGQPLHRIRIDPNRAAEVMREVAGAVQYAHDRGILHRDLKPQNLMLDEAGRVWVMDFGLARQIAGGSTLTLSGTVAGTPAYMSPEQATGERGDARSDVYSLGATLYEVLTGRPPFEGKTPLEILDRARSEDPVPPRRAHPGIDRDLESIVLKAMEKPPERRYASAKEFGEDLRRYRAGEPVVAQPIGLARRGAKWARRHPTIVAVTAAILIAIGWIGGSAVRENSRRKTMVRDAAAAEGAGDLDRAEDLYGRLRELGHPAAAERIVAIRDERRRRRAREEVARARDALARRDEREGERAVCALEAERLEREIPAHAPSSAKEKMWAARDAEARAESDARAAETEAEQAALAALRFDERNAEARRLLAGLYLARWVEAERDRREDDQRRFAAMLERYGGPADLARLSEPATLDLGVDGHLFRYVERDRRLIPMACSASGEVREPARVSVDPGASRERSVYPLDRADFNRVTTPLRIAAGRYLFVTERGTRYPVLLERGKTWTGRIEEPEEVPPGFVFVPGGPALFLRDSVAGEFGRPREREGRVEVPSFFIATFEVTCGEYLEFLNDRNHHDVQAALLRAPRRAPFADFYARMQGDRIELLAPFASDWPIISVSALDAEEYARWLGKRDARWTFRLPEEDEWEKASRGVDGRFHVWGDEFDATFSKMMQSRNEESRPEAIGTFPADESPYGVRDLAGSAREWIRPPQPGETYLSKGGSWGTGPTLSRAVFRGWNSAKDVSNYVGFRIVAERR